MWSGEQPAGILKTRDLGGKEDERLIWSLETCDAIDSEVVVGAAVAGLTEIVLAMGDDDSASGIIFFDSFDEGVSASSVAFAKDVSDVLTSPPVVSSPSGFEAFAESVLAALSFRSFAAGLTPS